MTKSLSIYATCAFMELGLVRGLVRGLAVVGLAGNVILGSSAIADTSSSSATAIPPIGSQCLSCHGTDGRPALADVPIIAGQQPIYLANALRHYKSGQRTGGQALVMQEMVKDLTDKDIEALAIWFGEQK